jgi:UDP:flavonoid glycosyltransferase YjiC (YdhE family)
VDIGADPGAFEPLPPNVVVEQFVSQALQLPRCSAVVCHAGAGTVIGALSQGCAGGLPACRARRGQFANAEQVARLGAGITLLPDQVSVESITRRVLDETWYSIAARRLRSDIELLTDPSAVVAELTRRATGRGF